MPQVTKRYANVFLELYFRMELKMTVHTRGVRSRLFWTPAPVLTNQTPDPGQSPYNSRIS